MAPINQNYRREQLPRIPRYMQLPLLNQSITGSGAQDVTTNLTSAYSAIVSGYHSEYNGNGGAAPVVGSITQGTLTSGYVNTFQTYTKGIDTTHKCAVSNVHDGGSFTDGNGNGIFARMSFASSVWSVTFYSIVNGVETAYTIPATAEIDDQLSQTSSYSISIPVVTDDLCAPADVDLTGQNTSLPGEVSVFRIKAELLSVTALNTVSDLSITPADVATVMLIVNGLTVANVPSGMISVSGKVVTWNVSNLNLVSTDRVVAHYSVLA